MCVCVCVCVWCVCVCVCVCVFCDRYVCGVCTCMYVCGVCVRVWLQITFDDQVTICIMPTHISTTELASMMSYIFLLVLTLTIIHSPF